MIALAAIAVLLLLDMQNIAARRRHVLTAGSDECDDYTIVVPIYGDPSYFANGEALRPYRPNVLLAVAATTPVMRAFADAAERDGWRVHRCDRLLPLPQLVERALRSVSTTWVIRLDGDAAFVESPARAIAAVAAADADLCSVKVMPASTSRLIEKLQSVEYAAAMLGRHHRPWLTSGACMVGRTCALRAALRFHSTWFLGEDIETGSIARRLGQRVAHLDVEVRTTVPSTVRALVRQRASWWGGCFRQTWVNLDHAWDDPIALVYRVGLVWLLWAAKGLALSSAWRLVPIVIVVYTGVTVVSNWSVRSRWMILFPYYSLAQSLLMPPLGVVQYVRVALRMRSLGRYRMPHPSLVRARRRRATSVRPFGSARRDRPVSPSSASRSRAPA